MMLLRSLCYAIVLSIVPTFAWADESLTAWAERTVDAGLVKPLAKKEQKTSRFSRVRPAPRERRVRVTQASLSVDKRGRAFVPFAVDLLYGLQVQEDDLIGCVYRGSGEIFIKRGDGYRPAAFLLGKNVQAVAGACESAPTRS